METLNNYLPKDLVNIVEEYSVDRSKYDHVIRQLKREMINSTQWCNPHHEHDSNNCIKHFLNDMRLKQRCGIYPHCIKYHYRIDKKYNPEDILITRIRFCTDNRHLEIHNNG